MVQGEKSVVLGSETFRYTPEHYLISSVHLPVTGTVTNAYPHGPYLALSVAMDIEVLAELLLITPASAAQQPARALGIGKLSPNLLDAFLRLARLLNEPALIPQLAPLIKREILIRLLASPEAPMLVQIATQSSRAAGVARAILAIREGYAKTFSATALARIAGMSLPSFNRHFRTVTEMSALQYQKQIRLQEARRQLLVEQDDAAMVGFSVGYASPSQFSREYARTFGRPPQEDAAWMRRQAALYEPLLNDATRT
jgi:AraC-like DNA-binding protein